MKLLALLLALLALACPRSPLSRGAQWLPKGLTFLEQQLSKARITSTWVQHLIIWVIPVVVLLLLQYWFCNGWWSIFYIVLNVVVLLLCLTPNPFSAFMAKSLCRRGNKPVTVEGEVLAKDKSKTHAVDGIVEFQVHLFAPVIWFLIFGAAGALGYRLWVLFAREKVAKNESTEVKVKHWCQCVLALLDGFTARIWILLMMLAGNFASTFGIWWESLFRFQQSAADIVKEASKAALGQEQTQEAADDLLDRSMILLLVIVAMLTLTAWLS